ncbi:MAG: phage major capsid protein [Cellulosilyticaceae bacterium]
MLKSVELKIDLENLKNQISEMKEAGQIEEAHSKLEEVKSLKNQIIAAEQEEEEEILLSGYRPINNTRGRESKNMEEVKEMSVKLFQDAVMPGELMADKVQDNTHNDVNLGKLVRGVMVGDWSNAAKEQKYLNAIGMDGDGSVLIPSRLSSSVYDLARSKSAIWKKVPTITLDNGNMTLVKVAANPTGHWIAPGEQIPVSQPVFAPVKLKSKTLAMLVPVSEILLKEGQNVEEAVRMAMANTLAETMDKALLYGKGDGTEEAKEPKGILAYANINKDTFSDTVKYTDLVKGVKHIGSENHKTTDAVMATNEYYDLLSSTNANGDFLNPPKALENVEIQGSNNINNQEVVLFDQNSIIVGAAANIAFDKGFTTDGFSRLEKAFRMFVRIDVAIVEPKAISHLTKQGSAAKALKK